MHGDTGGINVAFKYLVSEFYSRDLSVKLKSAKYVKFRRGEYQSTRCPYGYQKGADGRLEPDEKTAPNVRLIFELARSGYGASQIAKELFQRGIPTPTEYRAAKSVDDQNNPHERRIWSPVTVSSILTDERYAGTYIIGKRESTEIGGKKERTKDESQWIKIPNHHLPLISMEVFTQVQSQRPRSNRGKQSAHVYPLRKKMFCGCCRHALMRSSHKNHWIRCRYTIADEAAPCHGLKILESDLEHMLYEILSKQAQIILNLDDLSGAGALDVQRAKQSECGSQVELCMDKKQALYEQLLLKEITVAEYRAQKIEIDRELDRLKQAHSVVTAQIEQIRTAEKKKHIKRELAREIVKSNNITVALADALIERVYVYPHNRIEIVWKMKNFCMEDL